MATALKDRVPRRIRPSLSSLQCEESTTRRWVWDRPITFEEFVDLYMGRGKYVELVDGTVVEKDMVQFDHGKLEIWLVTVMNLYTSHRKLGIVMSSRFPTKVSTYRGRLPDIFFVRRENEGILQQKGAFGAPDVVIEIRSPSDRKGMLIALETDYRTLGVPEIAFIDLQRRQIRLLRKRGDDYAEEILTEGCLEFDAIPGLRLDLEWLFHEPRPDELDLVNRLVAK